MSRNNQKNLDDHNDDILDNSTDNDEDLTK